MTDECKVNCKDNPDAVEKINWKCVECKRDLKADFERVVTERKAKADQEEAEMKARNPAQLSDVEIQKRREMQNV